MNYEQYRAALAVLVAIVGKRDFSPAGEAEFQAQAAEVKRLYLIACQPESEGAA